MASGPVHWIDFRKEERWCSEDGGGGVIIGGWLGVPFVRIRLPMPVLRTISGEQTNRNAGVPTGNKVLREAV
jgi:hypothetical protein